MANNYKINYETNYSDIGFRIRNANDSTFQDYVSNCDINSMNRVAISQVNERRTIDIGGIICSPNYTTTMGDSGLTFIYADGGLDKILSSINGDVYMFTDLYGVIKIPNSQTATRTEATADTALWYINIFDITAVNIKDTKLRDHDIYTERVGMLSATLNTTQITGTYVDTLTIQDPGSVGGFPTVGTSIFQSSYVLFNEMFGTDMEITGTLNVTGAVTLESNLGIEGSITGDLSSVLNITASETIIKGDVTPWANSTYDLGAPATKWKDLNVTNVNATDINIVNDILPTITDTSKLGSNTKPFNTLYTKYVFSKSGDDLRIASGDVGSGNAPHLRLIGAETVSSGLGGSIYLSPGVGDAAADGTIIFDGNMSGHLVPQVSNISKLGSPAIPFNSLYTYNVFNSVEGQDLTIKCLESNNVGGDIIVKAGDSIGSDGGSIYLNMGEGDSSDGKIYINGDTEITGTLTSSGLISAPSIYLDGGGSEVNINGNIMAPEAAYTIKPIDSVAGWDLTIQAGGGTTSNDGGETFIRGGTSVSGNGGDVTIAGGTSGSGNHGNVRLDPGDGDVIFDSMSTATSSPYYVVANSISGGNYTITRGLSVASDIKYKENLKVIDSPLEKIKTLNGYYFNWNEKYKEVKDNVDTNNVEIGLVAQEVKSVLPELVEREVDDNVDFLWIHYDKFPALFVEAFKEQSKLIEELKERIITLENK